MTNNPHLEIVNQWILKAENDLKNAQHTLKMGEDCPFDTVCFHAQQCVEKYLKAALSSHKIDFPKIHDLTELVVLLPGKLKEQIDTIEMAELNPYAIESRYPGEPTGPSREEAIRAVKIAEKTKATIRSHLPLGTLP